MYLRSLLILCSFFGFAGADLHAKKSVKSKKTVFTLKGKVQVKGKIPELLARYNRNAFSYPVSDATKLPTVEKHSLVYIEGVKGSFVASQAELTQEKRIFMQDIVPVVVGGKVSIRNDDTVFHHIRSQTKPWSFNLKKKGPGETVDVAFDKSPLGAAGVVPIYCDIHSKMRSHIVVLKNPFYVLVPEKGGEFSIEGLPEGEYTLSAFHPTLKPEPVKIKIGPGNMPMVTLVMVGE